MSLPRKTVVSRARVDPRQPETPAATPIESAIVAAIGAYLTADSTRTLFSLAQVAGVSRSALSRFVAGQTGLSLDNLERLAVPLQIRIAAAEEPAKPARKRPR